MIAQYLLIYIVFYYRFILIDFLQWTVGLLQVIGFMPADNKRDIGTVPVAHISVNSNSHLLVLSHKLQYLLNSNLKLVMVESELF